MLSHAYTKLNRSRTRSEARLSRVATAIDATIEMPSGAGPVTTTHTTGRVRGEVIIVDGMTLAKRVLGRAVFLTDAWFTANAFEVGIAFGGCATFIVIAKFTFR